MLFIYKNLQKKSPFDLHTTQIEQYVKITCLTWKSKPRPQHHYNMQSNGKQDILNVAMCLKSDLKE